MHGHTTLLNTASGGDPSLLKALAFIENRASQFSDTQLVALHALVQAWVRQPEPADLTARQREILALLSEGLTVQAIARRLCLSPRTVAKHLERMYRRLGTTDRLTTVLQAQRRGLLGLQLGFAASPP